MPLPPSLLIPVYPTAGQRPHGPSQEEALAMGLIDPDVPLRSEDAVPENLRRPMPPFPVRSFVIIALALIAIFLINKHGR